jgi:nanoRNase/pAp phosphatase (c-di-AMP/oligoRNAs hydrolase)
VSLDNDKFLESILSNKEYLDNAIKYGKRLFDLQRERNQIICSNFAFTTRFEGLNLSVIKGHGNSLLFGDTIKDYDAVCIYYKLPDGRYRYSMYSADNKANVSSICQRYGGGGHIHAAGFTSDTDFFCN